MPREPIKSQLAKLKRDVSTPHDAALLELLEQGEREIRDARGHSMNDVMKEARELSEGDNL